MIISDNPLRLTCPHCGKEKYIRTILSGNTFGGKGWSDGRWYFPMLKRPSPYQKCRHCRHYFSLEEANPTDVEMQTPGFEFVWRTKEEDVPSAKPQIDPEVKKREDKWRKEASNNRFGDLAFDELVEARKDILPRCTTAEQRERYYLNFVHEYNDARTFRIDGGWVIGLEDYRPLFEEYARELSVVKDKPQTLNAEMCRELGEFDRAIELCHQLLDAGTDVEAVRQILAHAEAHDPDVFELQFEEKEL